MNNVKLPGPSCLIIVMSTRLTAIVVSSLTNRKSARLEVVVTTQIQWTVSHEPVDHVPRC